MRNYNYLEDYLENFMQNNTVGFRAIVMQSFYLISGDRYKNKRNRLVLISVDIFINTVIILEISL